MTTWQTSPAPPARHSGAIVSNGAAPVSPRMRLGRRRMLLGLLGVSGLALASACDATPPPAPSSSAPPATPPGTSSSGPARTPGAAALASSPAGPTSPPAGPPAPSGPVATTVQIVPAPPGSPVPAARPGPPLVVPGRSPSPLASPPALASPSPVPLVLHRPGLLAVERDGRIVLVDPEGGQPPRTLVDGPDNAAPRWSPDGRAVLIVGGVGPAAELMVAPAAGGSPRRLTANRRPERAAAWAPDGRQIAYTVPRSLGPDGAVDPREPAEVWLLDLATGQERKLADGLDPAWTPDGRALAYATNGQRDERGPRDNAIHIVSLADGQDRPVLTVADLPADLLPAFGLPFRPGTLRLRAPAWSPDGLWLVASADGHTSMALMFDRRGQGIRPWALAYEGGVGRACWAPDGARLAVESQPATGVEVVVLAELASGRETRLGGPNAGYAALAPAWAPDASRLAVVAASLPGQEEKPRSAAVRVLGPDGANLGQLLDGPGLRALDWGRAP